MTIENMHISGPTEVGIDVEAPATVQLIVDVPWYTAGTEHHELRIANMQIDIVGDLAVTIFPYCSCGWTGSATEGAGDITAAYREHLT